MFLSGTSSDLGECRRRASEILLSAGIFPVVQDYFGPDSRTIEELLTSKILAADAVVCLIGHAFGTSPIIGGVASERSYTQIEYDLALRYDKQVFLLVATDEYAQINPVSEADALRDNQQVHRNAILLGSRRYQQFSTEEELGQLIYALVQPILSRAGRRSFKYIHIPPAPACFVGRTDEIIQLDQALNRNTPAIIAIMGMGGQGKTTLVAQTLRRRNTLPFAAGLWVSAEHSDFTFSEFLDCALSTFIGASFAKTDMPRLDIRLRKLMDLLQTRPLLIVIDAVERWFNGWLENREVGGFEDLSLRQGAYEGLDQFLSEASALENGSHLVLTSRALPASLDTVSCAILPVLPENTPELGLRALPLDASIELLEKLGMIAPREKLRELAETLVGHPLALTGFARVARRLGGKWESLLVSKGTDPSRVVHSLVDEIRKHLPNRQRSEAILKYASLLPEGPSSEILGWLLQSEPEYVLKPVSDTDLLPLILNLADWNLLIWDPVTQSIQLHALIAGYFAEPIAHTVKISIHRRAAIWYEAQASTSPTIQFGVLAIRHALHAKDLELAYRAMFHSYDGSQSLKQRMICHGHLWECAELLASIQAISTGVRRAQCILTRAQILNDLELSSRALDDVHTAARLLLEQGEAGWVPVQTLLAQCYGLEGVIHLETGRASDALPLLNKAIDLFMRLGDKATNGQLDLIKTTANRGLAKWSCGDWNGAEKDYSDALNLLFAGDLEKGAVDEWMLHELRTRIAALSVDHGDPASAVQQLENEVLEIQKLQAHSSGGQITKNALMAKVFLATAYIGSNRLEEALELVQKSLLPLEEMSCQGRWEFNAILAQLRLNEATVLLQMERTSEALQASQRAICLYEDMVGRGAVHFQGQLGTALFRRSEARFRAADEGGGICDLQHALKISTAWLRDWYGECNIQSVFIDNALRTLSFLPDSFVPEKKEILQALRECIERAANTGYKQAAAMREIQILKENWTSLRKHADQIGISWNSKFPEIAENSR